ncbi:RNA-binding S4 domain-containing protein [candidate division KSB1 bacterium]|nr:RNA-binding S4 domain-containing protein [candidate division KSB1 bacterium]
MKEHPENSIRIDQWLNISCIIKTRSQARKACEEGRVKVNDQTTKASRLVKVGDVVEVRYKWHHRTFDIRDIAHKSISHEKARLLYHEHELSAEEKEALAQRQEFMRTDRRLRPKFKGRPTKKERRQLEQFRKGD